MTTINISHAYTMPANELKAKLEGLSKEMSSRYQLRCQWQSDRCLSFKRSGASGNLQINAGTLVLRLKLGLMLGAFKGAIEQDIKKFVVDNIH